MAQDVARERTRRVGDEALTQTEGANSLSVTGTASGSTRKCVAWS